ncbi:hypothetical protein MANES_18G080250v8 [Manihot esculenta]|uniref:Uncharacterized protein n=1 Tax=Manihot esculenta TaxID=3983 RepID=A0ACB7G065_MANES|nr:hypothetical protein MANES_18G080250v8 [Manihot esculenta]
MDMKGKKTEVGGSQGAGPLIIIVSIIVISWILGLDIIGINAYYLSTSFVGWLLNNNSISFGQMLPYCLPALGFIVMGRRPLLFIIF